MKKKTGIAVLLILLLAAGGAAWYFLHFTKTPEYSINLIRESVQTHDVAKFKKHVDLDSLLDKGVDDLLIASMKAEPGFKENQMAQAFAMGLMQMIKPPLVSALNDKIIEVVEKGRDSGKTEGADTPQASKKENAAEDVSKTTGINTATFEGIDYSRVDGSTANVGVIIQDSEINEKLTLDVKLRKLEDGTWQVFEITNLKDYLLKVAEKKKEKLIPIK